MPSIIISRFNEDLSWLKNYENKFKIIIYNKGTKLKKINYGQIINLPNVGRESHTWVHHIFNNFENLDNVNIFLQGKIDDLNCMAYQNLDLYIRDLKKDNFSSSRLGLLGPFHWSYNVGIEKDSRYYLDWKNNKIKKSQFGFRNFAKTLFPEIPIFVATSYGGCFAVSKEAIKIHNKEFYGELLKILGEHQNPIEGHYLERLWCYMFTKNKLLLPSIKDVFLTKIERSFRLKISQ